MSDHGSDGVQSETDTGPIACNSNLLQRRFRIVHQCVGQQNAITILKTSGFYVTRKLLK